MVVVRALGEREKESDPLQFNIAAEGNGGDGGLRLQL